MTEKPIQQAQAGTQRDALTLDDITTMLAGQLGDANLQPRGLKTAPIKDGADIGRTDAVVAFAQGLTGAGGLVTLTHTLGRVPGYCRILQVIPPVGAVVHVVASPKDYEKWTATTVRQDLFLVGPGSMDGVIVVFEIGGERQA